jgi:hypothetical protein
VVPAQRDRESATRDDLGHRFGGSLAGCPDHVQVRYPAAALHDLGDRDLHVTPVSYDIAQLFQAVRGPGVTQGARTHVHPAPPLSEVHRHADDLYRLIFSVIHDEL